MTVAGDTVGFGEGLTDGPDTHEGASPKSDTPIELRHVA